MAHVLHHSGKRLCTRGELHTLHSQLYAGLNLMFHTFFLLDKGVCVCVCVCVCAYTEADKV